MKPNRHFRGTAAIACVAIAAVIAPPSRAQTLPPGFSSTLLYAVPAPTALAMLPDGRILITQQTGTLRVVQGGAVLAAPALTLGTGALCSNGERGLLGVAVDPQFGQNGYIYLFYTRRLPPPGDCSTNTANSPVNRVSRFVLQADNTVLAGSETVLIDNVPSPNSNHNGGDLHFGKDGFLYVSTGDGGCDYAGGGCAGTNDATRDQFMAIGKILRIDRNGGIPATNPFQGAGTARCNLSGGTSIGNKCQETFAWGFRNPFRFAMDPNATGTRFFVNDVGQDAWEEIDDAQAGLDYGWNCREGRHVNNTSGPCSPTPPGMVDPLFEYAHGTTIPGTTSPTNCNAITGGAFVPNGLWPGFDSAYLFADYGCGVIVKLTQSAGVWSAANFVSGLGGSSATSLRFMPYGTGMGLYYTTYAGGGEVRVITYAEGGNTVPTANGSALPSTGEPPLDVTFGATGSTDPDPGDVLTFVWDFGDGATAVTTDLTIHHVYAAAGSYVATLRVRDSHFAFAPPLTFPITVGNAPPSPLITAPGINDKFAAGQQVTLTGTGFDPEEGALPGSALAWEVLVHHADHTHLHYGPVTGATAQFVAPAPEDLAAVGVSHLEIRLTATDSHNAATTVSQDMQPRIVDLTLRTVPAGLAVQVSGQPVADGQAVAAWQGWSVSLSAPPQASGAQTWYFNHWSDAGASTHAIVTPAAAATYTATFSTAPLSGLDLDADGQYGALTDGLLLLRHLFGVTGTTLTAGALGNGALRTAPAAVGAFIAGQGLAFDVDGNADVDALTDGLLVLRYLFGVRGPTLIAGAVGPGATRTTAPQIEAYLAALLP